jgi:hypothetical protein
MNKSERLQKANALLETIADCGRKFFRHNDLVSRFELDRRGRIWFIDAYRSARIYTHYTRGRWRGFSEGGTLRDLVIALRNYIATGKLINPVHFGPWPDWYCDGDVWGYGQDMEKVRAKAIELEIIPTNSSGAEA